MTKSIFVTNLGRTFGAQIQDVDVRTLSNDDWIEIREILVEKSLILFRDQNLNNQELFEFAKSLGTPMRSAFSHGVEKHPEIIEIIRREDQKSALSTLWHSDSTYLEKPPIYTILIGDILPPFGGNTSFSDVATAFEDLSKPLQDLLMSQRVLCCSDLHADNDRYSHVSKPSNAVGTKEIYSNWHPAAILNPDSNRLGIYANEEHALRFEHMTMEESRPILEFLSRHIQKDKYRVEINWAPGTLAISDNRATQHRAVDNYFGHYRKMRRVIVH